MSTVPPGEARAARRALVLGTLPGQADAMHRLHEAGWTVYACGHRREGSGVEVADEFFLADIVDVDQVTDLARNLEVDVVYSVGSDIAMPTIARVNERLGLPGFHDVETTEILHRKDRLRSFLADHDLSPVRHRRVAGVADLTGFDAFPAIVKPTDSQGQRGITIVDDHEGAAAALPAALEASRTGTAIVEELLAGPEISIHVVVVEGQVRFFLPSDRHVWDGPLVGIPEAHTMPSSFLGADDRVRARDLVERVVAALGVRTGPLYFQMILTDEGPRIVEIAPRLDGCHLWRLIEVHLGFDLLTALFDLLVDGQWHGPDVADVASTHTLRFHLGPPDEPFDPAAHAWAGDGRVVFEELQVEPGGLPRDVNGVVARLGYAITEDRR